MLTVAEDEPPLLLAQIVNVLSVINELGVPQIVPLLVPNVKPLGSAGLIAQEVIAPEPVSVAFSGRSLLVRFLVNVKSSGEYDKPGNWSRTSIVIVVVFVPPELRTVIVYVVLVDNSVGVPEISPVIWFSVNPEGRSGLIE